MTQPELSIESIAQKMLDKHGFFVIFRYTPVELPVVVNDEILSSGPNGHLSPIRVSFKVYAEASWGDFVEQCSLSGVPTGPPPEFCYFYKAIAE